MTGWQIVSLVVSLFALGCSVYVNYKVREIHRKIWESQQQRNRLPFMAERFGPR